ncbi:MAG: tRNA (adenosine(37)-N6)-threonylcarbamoyltransferase complex ATPase subunit type 1 TsaE [Deltaproteobacteria bacterium]|nr:tRNA (adenosine(37)-N6)-threonylcarbamoyltransferase complex ATPase subunit type 1 TsaE [Deltaproteobacteria bacterium]
MILISHSPEETRKIARELAPKLKPGTILGLKGDLGSGKTTFVQGLAEGLGISKKYYVNSPTFTLLNEYEGEVPLYHFDLYRLESPNELKNLGWEEYWEGKGISVIEWPERLPAEEQKRISLITFTTVSETTRSLELFFKND